MTRTPQLVPSDAVVPCAPADRPAAPGPSSSSHRPSRVPADTQRPVGVREPPMPPLTPTRHNPSSPKLPEASAVLGAVCLLLLQPPLPATSHETQRCPRSPGEDHLAMGAVGWQRWGCGCEICCWVGIAAARLPKNPHILFFNGKLIVLLFPPYGPPAQHPAGMHGPRGLLRGRLRRGEAAT